MQAQKSTNSKYALLLLPLLAVGLLAGQPRFRHIRTTYSQSATYKRGLNKMTLPVTVYTNIAGLASVSNSSFGPQTLDGSSYPLYPKNSNVKPYLRWDANDNVWIFDPNDSASSSYGVGLANASYYSNGGQTLASGPVGTYAVGSLGVAPAPVVSTTNPASTPQNFALAFFSPSAGGPPSLSASWQQPAEGQPDGGYNLYLGPQSGMETLALNVPGAALSHTFGAYGYGTVFGYVTAVYSGAESASSSEASANAPAPSASPALTATPTLANGIPAILLTGSGF